MSGSAASTRSNTRRGNRVAPTHIIQAKTLQPETATPARGHKAVPIKSNLIITIDGPAGTGKSTVARLLAARLGLDFLDTGAMYRGVTAMALSRGIDLIHEPFYVVELARNCPLRFDWQTDPPRFR